MPQKKVIVLVAPTGGNAKDREGAHIPVTPEEIAEEAFLCYEAGASAVHIHARDPETKQGTNDLAVFSDIIKRIRDKCDMLIQTTSGMGITKQGLRPTGEERMALLSVEPRQDFTTIPLGSWDIWRPFVNNVPGATSGFIKGDTTYHNTPDFLKRGISAILAKKIPFEIEVADLGFLNNALRLADEGVFDRHDTSFFLNYVLGFGGMPATPRHLLIAQEEGQRVFPQAKWAMVASGKEQFPMSTLAVALGCDIIRVGFEDNIHLPNEKPAQRNYQLVEAMVRIVEDLGREVATVDEARKVLGIKH